MRKHGVSFEDAIVAFADPLAVIVSTAGSMARMLTIHPLGFARIKRELGARPSREASKYRKDLLQAQWVTEMVHAYLPHLEDI